MATLSSPASEGGEIAGEKNKKIISKQPHAVRLEASWLGTCCQGLGRREKQARAGMGTESLWR